MRRSKSDIHTAPDGLFERNPPGTLDIFQRSCVGIAGCGGLGSNAAVALARCGIGRLIIADFDVVEPSNLNRQYFFVDEIGFSKAEALASRLRLINPEISVEAHNVRLDPENVIDIFREAQIMVEGFDRAESKKWLIETLRCKCPERHLVCASGLSGLGPLDEMKVQHLGKLHICGDGKTDSSTHGLAATRVAMAAVMEAHIVLQLILEQAQSGTGSTDNPV